MMNVMKRTYMGITALLIGFMVTFAVVVPAGQANAIDVIGDSCNGQDNPICDHKGEDANDTLKKIINTMLYVVGIISVIAIIYGGIQYTISTGDQEKVRKAKNTILYACVGLVVSIMAFGIVNFVVDNIG